MLEPPICLLCPRPVPPGRHAYCSRSCCQRAVAGRWTGWLAPDVREASQAPRLCPCGAVARQPRGTRGHRPATCAACYARHRAAQKATSKAARRVRATERRAV